MIEFILKIYCLKESCFENYIDVVNLQPFEKKWNQFCLDYVTNLNSDYFEICSKFIQKEKVFESEDMKRNFLEHLIILVQSGKLSFPSANNLLMTFFK